MLKTSLKRQQITMTDNSAYETIKNNKYRHISNRSLNCGLFFIFQIKYSRCKMEAIL